VIAIDQTFVTEMLRLSGPVKLSELPVALTNANFSLLLSYIVESKLSGRNDPKAILKSFLPAFEKKIFTFINPKALLPLFEEMADGGHLQAYSKDANVEAFFRIAGISGEMKTPGDKEDYLALAHTNIGGTKSDQFVQENIRHDTYLKLNGEIVDEVTLTRIHTWDAATERKISTIVSSLGFGKITPELWHILGRGDSVEMIRLYVPKGSTLENSSDPNIKTRIDTETGKTYFLFEMRVGALKTTTTSIRYKLPFKLNISYVDNYTLSVDKQPGQTGVTIQKRILPESTITNYKAFPEAGRFDLDGVWVFESPLNKDMKFSGVWGK
jgi:hypothetical protein